MAPPNTPHKTKPHVEYNIYINVICIYIYIYIHMYECMHACMHACMYLCLSVSLFVCIHNKTKNYTHIGEETLLKLISKVLLQHWWHQLKIVPEVISPNPLVLEQPGCWLTPGPSPHGAQCVAAALAEVASMAFPAKDPQRPAPEQGPAR